MLLRPIGRRVPFVSSPLASLPLRITTVQTSFVAMYHSCLLSTGR